MTWKWIVRSVSLGFFLTASLGQAEEAAVSWNLKPYRTLLVVQRWNDPSSLLIESDKDSFQPVAGLLKAWSVPFDFLRLDQQNLSSAYLFERSGKPRYGVVLWLTDSPSYKGKNLEILEGAVKSGTSIIIAGSRFLDPALEQILGLQFKEHYTAVDPFELGPSHFITRELGREKIAPPEQRYGTRVWVEPQGAQVLLRQKEHPIVTMHHPGPESAAIWLGVPSLEALRDSDFWRSLFFRSLLWSFGYLVLPDVDYSRRVLMMFDDWGCSDKSFLSFWRYKTPSEELLRRRVVAPLAKRTAVIVANVVTGFVDRNTRRILSPWGQKFTDRYGVLQDYASTQRGLKEGLAAGVVEIQSHGWTHMQADLDSPPGPWWSADLDGEASVGRWYEEFEDTRRGTETPALVQLFHLKRSIEYLQEDFGVRPLSVIIGGGGWSKSYQNHSARVAALAGFGLFDINERFFYLEPDLVLDMKGISPGIGHAYDEPIQPKHWPAHPDGPLVLIAHDRDIALQADFIERTLDALPKDVTTIGMNQYIGILHTRIASRPSVGWHLEFNFDEPYCTYFRRHSSRWKLFLADPLVERLKTVQAVDISVDGGPATRLDTTDPIDQPLIIEIPAGTGSHTWKLSPAR